MNVTVNVCNPAAKWIVAYEATLLGFVNLDGSIMAIIHNEDGDVWTVPMELIQVKV